MTTAALEQGQLCRRFWFIHKSGDLLYPCVQKSRFTGRLGWTVAKPGTGNNRAIEKIDVFSEQALVQWAVDQRYSVRCRSDNGLRNGLYNADGHSVRLVSADDAEGSR
jgi:hypothetical protein